MTYKELRVEVVLINDDGEKYYLMKDNLGRWIKYNDVGYLGLDIFKKMEEDNI